MNAFLGLAIFGGAGVFAVALVAAVAWTIHVAPLKARVERLERDLRRLQAVVAEPPPSTQVRTEAEPIGTPEPAPAVEAPEPILTVEPPEAALTAEATEPADGPDAPPPEASDAETPDAETPDSEAPAPPDQGPPEPQGSSAPPSWTPPSPERLITWIAAGLGGTTLVLAGLLGLAVAIERGLMGPAIRVFGGLTGGSVLWAAGVYLRPRIPVVGAALSGVAIGLLYGSLFAASGMYGLVGPNTAFLFMTALTVIATTSAYRDADRFTAHIALIGGVLTPVLVSTGGNRAIALFSYLVVLIAGILLTARRHRWWDLVIGAVIGAGGLYLGWTARWYVADQAPIGILAAFALALPFAWVARDQDKRLRALGLVGTAAFALFAVPWLLPIDPIFIDPQSYLFVPRPLDGAAAWAALGVTLLGIPTWWAVHDRDRAPIALGAGLLHSAILLIPTLTWAYRAPQSADLIAAMAVAPLVIGTLAIWRHPRQLLAGVGPLLVAAGLALAALAVSAPPSAPLAAGTGAAVIALLGLANAQRDPRGMIGVGVLIGAASPLIAATWGHEHPDPRLLGPTLFVLATLAVAPLSLTWRRPKIPLALAALTWPALWPALHALWIAQLGDPLVGALPLLLGSGALLGAVASRRIHGIGPDSSTLALFAAVAALGATAAVPLQLQEGWLTVAWALQAVAMAGLAHYVRHPVLRYGAVLLAITVAIRLLLNPWALSYGDGTEPLIFNWILYTWGIPALALLAVARWLPAQRDTLDSSRPILVLLAIAIGFGLINLQVTHGFDRAIPAELGGRALWQGMVRSLTWAGYGLALLLTGLRADHRALRFIGFSFLLLATGRVFLVDLWALSGLVRVASVGGLGLCLLLAAFLFERLVLRSTSSPESSR